MTTKRKVKKPKKLSPAQQAAVAMLPMPYEAWQLTVKEKTRLCLENKGIVVVRPMPGHRKVFEEDPVPMQVVLRTKPLPASYLALRKKSDEVGLPVSHKDWDLSCDRNHLIRYKPPVFGWMVRHSGTWLFDPHVDPPSPGDSWPADSIRCLGPDYPEARYFWWDGKSLQEVSCKKLAELVDETQKKYLHDRGQRLDLPEDDLRAFVEKRYHLDPAVKGNFLSEFSVSYRTVSHQEVRVVRDQQGYLRTLLY